MTHYSWDKIRKIANQNIKVPDYEPAMTFANGYILALEDMIEDLDSFFELSTDEMDMRNRIHESLINAQQTLDALRELQEEQRASEQGEHRAVVLGPGGTGQ